MSFDQSTTSPRGPRVLLDATGVKRAPHDVSEYILELSRAAGEKEYPLAVVCRPRDAKLFKSFNLEVHRAPDWSRSERGWKLWVQWGLPRLAQQLSADVLHSPHPRFPLFSPVRRVISVHSLEQIIDTAAPRSRKARRAQRWLKTGSMVRLDAVVPSAEVGEDYRRLTSARTNRVRVAIRGVDKSVYRIPTVDELHDFEGWHGLTDWIAVVATNSETEDVLSFLEGFRRATQFFPTRPSVVIAMASPVDPRVRDAVSAEVDQGFDVRVLDDVEQSEEFALLGGAQIVVQLDDSAQTGQGLIAAMACGATIVAKRTPTLVELGGNTVEFVDVTAASIEIVVTSLLKDPDRRQSLATSAVTRSRDYSWNTTLDAHIEAWQRAAARA